MQNRNIDTVVRTKTLIKGALPGPVLKCLRQTKRCVIGKQASNPGGYAAIKLTDDDIEQGTYKEYIGGDGEDWDRRGAFQLYFLQSMGMTSHSTLLEVGCGPARASRYLIDYLNAGNYRGVDYNADFIRAAETVSRKTGLDVKQPAFEVVQDFNFDHMQPVFDYALLFSVLNHCRPKQRFEFFERIPAAMREGGRIYISHAVWLDESYIPQDSTLSLTGKYTADDFDITKHGWDDDTIIWPIIEITKRR